MVANSNLDLGSHDVRSGDIKEEAPPLSWRMDRSESLSDWTIIVTCRESDLDDDDVDSNEKHVFHVHKNQLGVGPHRSEYFARLFRTSQVIEASNSTSEIELEYSAVEAFPAMLDFVYSLDGDVAATTDTAAALRHLATYFDIRELFASVTGFIRRDLKPDTAPLYLAESALYHDDKLLEAACRLCAQNISKIDREKLVALPPLLFEKVISSRHFECKSEALSSIVAAYFRNRPEVIDAQLLQSLTNPEKMPIISSDDSIFLLQLALDLGINTKTSLFERCLSACSTNWRKLFDQVGMPHVCNSSSSVSGDSLSAHTTETMNSEYDTLPPDIKLPLLEAALCAASLNVDATISKKSAENETLKKTVSIRESTLKDQNESIGQYLDTISDKEDQIIKLKDKVAQRDTKIERLERKIASKTDEISRLKSKEDIKKADIARLRCENERLKRLANSKMKDDIARTLHRRMKK